MATNSPKSIIFFSPLLIMQVLHYIMVWPKDTCTCKGKRSSCGPLAIKNLKHISTLTQNGTDRPIDFVLIMVSLYALYSDIGRFFLLFILMLRSSIEKNLKRILGSFNTHKTTPMSSKITTLRWKNCSLGLPQGGRHSQYWYL